MNKIWRGFVQWLVSVVLLVLFVWSLWTFINKERILEQLTIVVNGGEVATGINIDITAIKTTQTWSIVLPLEESDWEKYTQYKKANNFVSFSPANQGQVGGNYATNTQLMNAYLSKNTLQFPIPYSLKSGYLYIRLKKKTDAWLFIYWYGSNKNWYTVSGDLDKTQSLIDSDTELLYKLDSIPYIRFYDKKVDSYNWLSQMNLWSKNNYIAWFVRDYDGSNKIEELTIAWE